MKIKTQAAQAAAAIRKELKENFPQIKFSVKSENYAGGNSVNISWVDGVPESKVKAITSKYEYGTFNGMNDIYEYDNVNDNLPQVKYISEIRTISNEIYEAAFAEALQKNAGWIENGVNLHGHNLWLMDNWRAWDGKQYLSRQLKEVDFSAKAQPKPIKMISIDEEIKEEVKLNKLIDVGLLGCKLVEYSEKAIAVFGNTKPIKDKLKELGGRFNPFLIDNGKKCAGWVFAKSKRPELTQMLNIN
jgi:hypothetical protein